MIKQIWPQKKPDIAERRRRILRHLRDIRARNPESERAEAEDILERKLRQLDEGSKDG